MGKIKRKTYVFSSIALVAIIAGLLSIGTLDEQQTSIQNSYSSEPTVMQLTPTVDTIIPEEFVAETSSSILEPTEFKMDSSYDTSSDFKLGLIPFIQNADAILPSSTTVTFEKWDTNPAVSSTNAGPSVDASDNIFYIERNLNRIARLNPATDTVTMWLPPLGATGFTSFIDSGKLYTVASSRLTELDPSTSTINTWNLAGGLFSPKKAPNGLFYALTSGGGLVELDSSNAATRFWSGAFGGSATDMDIDSSGNIWVTTNANTIFKFDPTNDQRTHWIGLTTSIASTSVDIDQTSGDVYFSGFGKVHQLIPTTPATVTSWTPLDGTFSQRGSMTLDSSNNPYFISSNQQKILRLIPSQNQFTIWELGTFAMGVSMDSNDNVVFPVQELSGGLSFNKIGRLS